MKKKLSSSISWFTRLSFLKKGVIVLLILGLLGFAGYKTFAQKSNKPTYQTAQVERGTLISSVTASGTISSANSASITTSATGVVKDVYVANGDTVYAGQKIADITLDQSSLQKQTSAYASYLSAQNSLNAANSKMNSLQSSLFTANQKFVTDKGTTDPTTDDPQYIIERADWLQAESDYNNQKGVIAAAQASFSSASLDYAQTSGTITAPMSGKINNLTLVPGLSIAGSTASSSNNNSSTTTSSTSQSLGSIEVEGGQTQATVNLSEIDITKVKNDQKVTITMDAFPDKSFTGKVIAIDTNGSVSSGVTMYPVTIVFDSSLPTMYPNMAVSASIITSVKSDALLVPSSAIQTSNGESTVQVMKNGKPTSVTVETGESNDTETEVTSGLSEGDTIVTSTISNTTSTSGQNSAASPFGTSGLGGANRGFGGGGGAAVFRSTGGGNIKTQSR